MQLTCTLFAVNTSGRMSIVPYLALLSLHSNLMVYIQLLFLLVLLGNVRRIVGNSCPAGCRCNASEATCVDSSLTAFPGERFPKYLQKLDISRNSITELRDLTIRDWMIVSLKVLNLSNNAINSISGKSLIGQSGLETLDLSGNEITTIPLKTFSYPPRLLWLSLANNRKLQVPEHSPLLESESLQVLHLEYCNLDSICVTNLEKLVALKELYLGHNKINIFSSEVTVGIDCLQNIRILDVSHNQLQKLPEEIINLPKLEKVDMRKNYLTVLKDGSESCEAQPYTK